MMMMSQFIQQQLPFLHIVRQKALAVSMAGLVILGTVGVLTADAHSRYDRDYRGRYGSTYFDRHPYQKSGLIGAGVGAGAGALLARDGRRTSTAVKGAVLGGAAGLGYQYLKRQGTFW